LPANVTTAGATGARFCCTACAVAHSIIQAAGLGAYYERPRELDPVPARPSGKSYAEYDDPAFASRHLTAAAAGGARLELFVSGIHCTACVWLLERLPRVQPGVRSARFELGRSALEVIFEPARVRPSEIARALDRLGYAPHPSLTAQRDGERRSDRALWVRLGLAGALAGNVMLMALALYSGAAAEPAYASLFRWGSCLLTLPAVFFCGSVFLRGALASLRTRTPHMDLPISIGVVTGFARSAWNTALGSGEVYFDSLAVLIFLLLVGRWLQARHHRGATQTLELIAALAPATALRVDGEPREVPADALPAGAVVEVARDARIPADGVVVTGESCVDTAWLTGEALPEAVTAGARVYAGTVNLGTPLRLRVEVAGRDTRLGRLMRSVEEAQAQRAPIVRLTDRVAGYYVVAALGLALVTFVLWHFLDPARAVDHAVALLVVTCPCALGMATPLAVSAALERAAAAGIFFKGGEFLEALARPGTLVFDKTGTLTEGRLALASFTGDPRSLPLLRAAESRSGHPIARAVVAGVPAGSELAVEAVTEFPGAGVVARVAGHDVRVGSAAFLADALRGSDAAFERELGAQAALGRSAIGVAVDGELEGVLAFTDPLRADARASLDALRAAGYRIAVLSGDQPLAVRRVASELGPLVSALGGQSPEQKLAWLERARRSGPVVMIGDGINDAAAMSAASVAIAVHGGAEAALVAADAFTTVAGVGKVLEAVRGARRTLAVIRRGVAFSLAYNVAGVGLCMAGLVSPLLAAVLMPLSSLTVVTSALEARTFEPPARKDMKP
jgi:Cu2+-exporting ATPase